MTNHSRFDVGCGVGLRSQHYPVITEIWPPMDWFEAVSENYMDTGGRPIHILEKVRQHYPVALHGTALSIGSIDPLNQDYLARLKNLIDRIEPFIVSDHLCWSGAEGEALHDLLPLPFTEEALRHIVERVQKVQDRIGRKILLENVSSYLTYRHSTITEWEFLTQTARRSGCGILLDLNNLYVNAVNHQFDPYEYLNSIPGELIGQFHLAGHTDMGAFLFDTHSAEVIDPVWELYRRALKLWGRIPALIEWDDHIPPFERLAQEAETARKIYAEIPLRHPEGQGPEGSQILRRLSTDRQAQNDGQAEEFTMTNISLTEVQRWFKTQVQPFEKKNSLSVPVEKILNPQGGAEGKERLSVYANGYLVRIAESLKETYEAVYHVAGQERFSELADAYARRYPSKSYNLNDAGRHFPEFLKDVTRHTTPFPFLSDLARLEWCIWQAFHAFDETPLDPEKIKGISLEDWENCRIIFQPSAKLAALHWSVLNLWLARYQLPEIRTEELARSQRILIGRNGDQVRCELLDVHQYRLLEGLLAGQSLGEACEELAETAEVDLPITQWFSHWVQDGLILRLDFSKNPTPESRTVISAR